MRSNFSEREIEAQTDQQPTWGKSAASAYRLYFSSEQNTVSKKESQPPKVKQLTLDYS
jgi:hypothetical protein